MNKEFFLALDMLEKEKGIPKEYMLEKIEAAQEEIDAKIAKMAENYGKTVEEFKKNIHEDDIKYITEEVRIQKLADFLVSNAKVKEVASASEEKPKKKTAAKKTAKTAEEKEAAPKKTTRKTTQKAEASEE